MTDSCGAPTTKGHPCKNDADACPWHGTDDPPKNGRDPKLTYERQEGIASMIEEGRSVNSAARTHEITPQTVYNWLDRGEGDFKAAKESIYADFFERITRAKGYGEEWYFNTVIEIAREEGDHRFIASLMKQRYPDSWGDTDTGVDAEQTVIELPESVTATWQAPDSA